MEELALLRALAAGSDEVALAEALDRSTAFIPAGDFIMGSETGREDERPAHRVYLDAYELDRYEVTNAQYRRFLLASGGRPHIGRETPTRPGRPTPPWLA